MDEYQHPYYQPFTQRWHKKFEPKGDEVDDFSFVIVENGVAFAGVLVMLYLDDQGNHKLSASGKPILFLENRNADYYDAQRAYQAVREEFDRILEKHATAAMIYWDFLKSQEMSFLGQYFLEKGAFATPYITRMIDLSETEEQLHQKLRKSFKSLVNWGNNNLAIKIFDENTITPSDIEKFRLLHLKVAGRQTRSQESWDVQYDMVVNKEAFLMLGDLNNELATGVFMYISKRLCYYGTSVSRRELFDKPMSHGLLWKSIVYAKNKGCKYFELGEQVYPRQANKVSYGVYEDVSRIYAPDEKALNIATFKRGFGGNTVVRLDIRWQNNIFSNQNREQCGASKNA